MVTPPIGSGQPPRLFELDAYIFQHLCRDLLYEEESIATSVVYGTQGHSQRGIDLIGGRIGGDGLELGQCKCHQEFLPWKIRQATREFLDHWEHWSQRDVKRFILFVACDLTNPNQQEEILEQAKIFRDLGIAYEAWDSAQILNKLRAHPDLIARYLPFWEPLFGVRPVSTQDSHTNQIISSAVLNQIDRLSEGISGLINQRVHDFRTEWRNGQRSSVLAGLRSIKDDSTCGPLRLRKQKVSFYDLKQA